MEETDMRPTRRTVLVYALAAPLLPLAPRLVPPAAALGKASYALTEAAEAAGHLLLLREDEQDALPPDTQRALGEALLWALKYDRDTSWLAAAVLDDPSRFPELLTRLQTLLATRATTLNIL